jgi:hypothetical protein
MKHNGKTQSDGNMNFDGMERMSPSRSMKYCSNQYSGVQNPNKLINKGRGPTVGNKSDDDRTYPDAAVVPKLPAQGSVRDNINRGSQYRGAGGVMPKSPSNPDKIRVGQSGGGTYNSEKPSKTPATQRGKNNFNFGPKSQY